MATVRLARRSTLSRAGLVDADLGGGLVKPRLYGFGKNDRSNIDVDELEEFRRLARGYLGLTAEQIATLIAENERMEATDDDDS